jgi:hypothetical protein
MNTFIKVVGLSLLVSITLNAGWIEVQKVVQGSGDGSLHYGFSIASNDDYTVVGAPEEDGSDGAVYVFKIDSNGKWQPFTKIAHAVVQMGTLATYEFKRFGYDVDIVNNKDIPNNTLIIGAPDSSYTHDNTTDDIGGVLVYNLNSSGDDFELVVLFTAPNHDTIGTSVAVGHHLGIVDKGIQNVYGPLTVIAYGWPYHNRVSTYINHDGESDWNATSIIGPAEATAAFGESLAFNGSGTRLMIGAPVQSTTDGSTTYDEKGVLYSYTMSGDYVDGIVWNERTTLSQPYYPGTPSLGTTYDTKSNFGATVDLDESSGTTRVIVGARREHIAYVDKGGTVIIKGGEARIFELTDPANDTWELMAVLKGDGVDSVNDAYGNAVAIRGNVAVVAASNYTEGAFTSGALFGYDYNGSSWNSMPPLIPSTTGNLGTDITLGATGIWATDILRDTMKNYEYRDTPAVNPAIIMYLLD